MQTYRTLFKNQIIPHLGEIKIQELTPALLEKNPFGTPLYIPLLLLYHTGMRPGEVLGLSWADIDFTEKRINVGRQMVYLSKRGLFLQRSKPNQANATS